MFRMFKRVSISDLPSRVQDEISRRDASSDRLTSWVQLCLICFISLLYSISPRAQGAEGFNFVPLAIGIYFGFTLVRLFLSHRIILPNWFQYLSILVDILFLTSIIFSFHIQYDQHPSFYLKTPTLSYIFVFIALRAQRFNPKYVIATGVLGALGWAALVAYSFMYDMDRMRLTRNYVEYLTGNSILIGAELDKIIVILSVTLLLGIALYRVRTTFVEAIRDNTAAEDLKKFFAPEVAQTITGSEDELSAGAGSVRDAAILMVDIRSFTATAAKMDPDKVMKILSSYQGIVVPIIEQNGGRVDKFLGDGILATFGAVNDSETFVADAFRSAQEIVNQVEKHDSEFQVAGWPNEFRIGVSVASGPITVGVVGSGNRLEFTVIGDPVNLAVKLDKSNKVLGTRALSTASCLEKGIKQGFDGESVRIVREVEVEGISSKMDLVDLSPSKVQN